MHNHLAIFTEAPETKVSICLQPLHGIHIINHRCDELHDFF